MASSPSRPKLIALVGPTASGKSALALKIAKEFDGEIIAADSRTIYKGMDIGTAKPTPQERAEIPHWGLDLVEPGEPFSAYMFQKYAQESISDIQNRGKLPILVGGTGLYIDSLLFDYEFSPPDAERDQQNPRHLKRGSYGVSVADLNPSICLIGLQVEADELKRRIAKRTQKYFKKGLIIEIKTLLKSYSQETITKSGGIAYQVYMACINAELTQKQAQELIQTKEWQYARRQKTWFRRNKFIQWYETPDVAFTSVREILNK